MKKLSIDDAEAKSADPVAGNIERLKELFPEAFIEGRIDCEVLKQLLGGAIDEREEKYGLNWHGKRRARQLALTPSTGTLRPCPEESVDWETTQNLMIEGDNLEVLKLLQKSFAGKVKLIYIDPPYNNGNDRIYPDDFEDNIQNYLMLTDQIDSDGRKISSNSNTSGRYHTDWLNLLYPRLHLAKTLLAKDGVMFVSIDEREYPALRLMCAEIFGEENFLGTIVWKNATDNNPTQIAIEHEYILVMARGKEALESEWKSPFSDVKEILIRIGNELTASYSGEELKTAYEQWYREHKRELWPLDRYKYIDEGGVYTGSQSVHNPGREGYRYDILHPKSNKPCKQPLLGYRFPKDTMDELLSRGRVIFGDDENKIVELKIYAKEFQDKLGSVLELDGRLGAYDLKEDFPVEGKVFSNPKPVRLLNSFLPYLLKSDGDVALDFFAGSGVLGKAIYEINNRDNVCRRFLLVQIPERVKPDEREQKAAHKLCEQLKCDCTIAEVTKERLRRAGKKIKSDNPKFAGDLGFRVFKLDSSNIHAWDPQPVDVQDAVWTATEHVKKDRSEQDVLFEILLKLGLDLTVAIETKTVAGKDVHSIGAGTLFVCLADKIVRDEIEPIALGIIDWHKALSPVGETTVVFRDSAFEDDVAKTNVTKILEQSGLTNVRSL